MKNTEHARLLDELADELLASCKTKPVDSPNYKRQSSLMQRARKAADEIEGREVATDENLRALRDRHQWPIGEFIYFGVARAVLARFGGGEEA